MVAIVDDDGDCGCCRWGIVCRLELKQTSRPIRQSTVRETRRGSKGAVHRQYRHISLSPSLSGSSGVNLSMGGKGVEGGIGGGGVSSAVSER